MRHARLEPVVPMRLLVLLELIHGVSPERLEGRDALRGRDDEALPLAQLLLCRQDWVSVFCAVEL